MRFDAHFGDAEAVQLKAAILLYGGAKRVTFASVHEPCRDPEGGAPYLDVGRPISMEFLRMMARGLGLGMAPEILPETVVMRTPQVTAWWLSLIHISSGRCRHQMWVRRRLLVVNGLICPS